MVDHPSEASRQEDLVDQAAEVSPVAVSQGVEDSQAVEAAAVEVAVSRIHTHSPWVPRTTANACHCDEPLRFTFNRVKTTVLFGRLNV